MAGKDVEIPTRENAWMVALAAMFVMAVFTLIPVKSLSVYVSMAAAVVELIVLVWMILRIRAKSSVVFGGEHIAVKRSGRVLRRIAVRDVDRITFAGGAFTVYCKGKGLPALMRAVKTGGPKARDEHQRALQEWCKRNRIPLQT